MKIEHTSSSRAIPAALRWLQASGSAVPGPLASFIFVTELEVIEADQEHYELLGGRVVTHYIEARESALRALREALRAYVPSAVPADLATACTEAGILGTKLCWSWET